MTTKNGNGTGPKNKPYNLARRDKAKKAKFKYTETAISIILETSGVAYAKLQKKCPQNKKATCGNCQCHECHNGSYQSPHSYGFPLAQNT